MLFLYLNRKQRKRNGVKRVYKEELYRSDSEDVSSDEDVNVTGRVSDNDSNLVQELGLKSAESLTTDRVASHPRAAKRTTWRKQQLIKKCQMPETRYLDNKEKKNKKKGNTDSKVNLSKALNGGSSEKDLAIDIESFVYHCPVVDDIDQVPETSSCPFCSVLCKNKQEITQHIKECHNSGKVCHHLLLIVVGEKINLWYTIYYCHYCCFDKLTFHSYGPSHQELPLIIFLTVVVSWSA